MTARTNDQLTKAREMVWEKKVSINRSGPEGASWWWQILGVCYGPFPTQDAAVLDAFEKLGGEK